MDRGASNPAEMDRLTKTQLRVLLADPTGNSKRVAKKLGISPHTVDGHFREIIRRLEVTDRLEAVARAHGECPQSLSAQSPGVAPPAHGGILNPPYELQGSQQPIRFQDVAVFDRESWKTEELAPTGSEDNRGEHSPMLIVSRIVLIAVGLVILGSAALPLGQGFEALAKLILDLHHQ